MTPLEDAARAVADALDAHGILARPTIETVPNGLEFVDVSRPGWKTVATARADAPAADYPDETPPGPAVRGLIEAYRALYWPAYWPESSCRSSFTASPCPLRTKSARSSGSFASRVECPSCTPA